jgi:hypothetical protein
MPKVASGYSPAHRINIVKKIKVPIDLREVITEESRVKGDLAKIVLLFALGHVDREKVNIM